MRAVRPWLLALGVALLLLAALLPVGAWTSWLIAQGVPAADAPSRRLGLELLRAAIALHGLVAVGCAWARPGPPPAPLWRPPPASAGRVPGGRAALLALLAVGALVRGIGLGGDLWHDELFTWLDLVRLPFLRILCEYPDDNQHLVFTLASHVSTAVFGNASWAVRLPAAAFGVASLWATWRLGRRLLGEREALFATALLTFSYHHVWFSQNARGYTALLFASVLSTDLLLRALSDGRWRSWAGYAAALALGMGAHLTMIFVAAAHGIVALVLALRSGDRRALARVLGGFGLAAGFTLLLLAAMLPQLVAFYTQPSAGVTTVQVAWKSPLWLLSEAVRSLGLGALGWVVVAAAMLPVAAGGLSLLRRTPAAAVAFALPPLLGFFALWALGRNLWPRFFFFSAGFAVLVLVHGVFVLGDGLGRRLGGRGRLLGSVAAALLVLASAATVPRVWAHPKQDFSGARDWVRAHAAPGDRIVAVGLVADDYTAYYAPDFASARSAAELEAQMQASKGTTWILYSFGTYIEARDPALWALVQGRFEEVDAFPGTLGGGTIVVRRYPPAPEVERPVQ